MDECGRMWTSDQRESDVWTIDGREALARGGREGASVHDRFGDCCAIGGRRIQSSISRPKSIAATDMQSI